MAQYWTWPDKRLRLRGTCFSYPQGHCQQSLCEPRYKRHDDQGARHNLSKTEFSATSILTPREREVFQLLAEGKTARQIAFSLRVSVKTIETYRQHIMHKLNLHNIAELTKCAIREGIISLETWSQNQPLSSEISKSIIRELLILFPFKNGPF